MIGYRWWSARPVPEWWSPAQQARYRIACATLDEAEQMDLATGSRESLVLMVARLRDALRDVMALVVELHPEAREEERRPAG